MKFILALIACSSAISLKAKKEPESQFKVDVHAFNNKYAGSSCRVGDTASVLYTGKLTNGQVFDQSTAQPFNFVLGSNEVIPCWEQAVNQMQAGETATVTCPPSMAYGQEGSGKIPGDATITFDIDVVNC